MHALGPSEKENLNASLDKVNTKTKGFQRDTNRPKIFVDLTNYNTLKGSLAEERKTNRF